LVFRSEEFTNAISSAAAQLQVVVQALKRLTCPPIRELTINLSELSQERINELLQDVPSGHAKDDKDADFIWA
jgi:hypothetical protein